MSDDQPTRPVAVFVHVHYLEIWSDICRLLSERLQVPFRLFITTSLPIQHFEEPQTPFHQGTTIVPAENRGRDIRPFLIALSKVDAFEIGLKLHTKRSTHRLDGGTWRDDILASLIPPSPETAALVQALADHPGIGIVAPRGFLLRLNDWVMANRPWMERTATLLGMPLRRSDWAVGSFAAGSMFWFRFDAIAPIADSRLFDMFEEEAGQTDGTLAHAIERLFALMAMQRNYSILSADVIPLVRPALSRTDLDSLGWKASSKVSPLFETHPLLRFAVRNVPSLVRIYGKMPIKLRRGIRGLLTGK